MPKAKAKTKANKAPEQKAVLSMSNQLGLFSESIRAKLTLSQKALAQDYRKSLSDNIHRLSQDQQIRLLLQYCLNQQPILSDSELTTKWMASITKLLAAQQSSTSTRRPK